MFFDTRISSMIWDIFSHCCVQLLSYVQLFATLWNVACQAPLSMRFSRQEYWSQFPFPPPPGGLPNHRIQPVSPALQVNSLPLSSSSRLQSGSQGISKEFAHTAKLSLSAWLVLSKNSHRALT